MVTTREQALEIAAKVRAGLEGIHGPRLHGVYLYGSAARDELTPESDIGIAVVLDEVADSFVEHGRISDLRQESDYRPATRITESQTREMLELAAEFVATCRRLCE